MIRRFFQGHARLFAGLTVGLACQFLPIASLHGIIAWDSGVGCYILLNLALFAQTRPAGMPANAKRQQDGEWVLFFMVLAAILVSFAAIFGQFRAMKSTTGSARDANILMLAVTLALSWLVTHVTFALRYAHEFYSSSTPGNAPDGGLQFPDEPNPDYWDFLYFALVLGMTFQVSDVQITARKLRRLATLHGLMGFGFNTVIIALTVNLASGLL